MNRTEAAEPTADPHEANGATAPSASSSTAPAPRPGGSRELLALAAPLIVSQSFMTVQVVVDTILLARHDKLEMTASFPAVMWYWLFFGLLQVTAGYTSTFVAQYTGARRPHRVGAAVWQGIHFAFVSGLLFLAIVPAAPFLIELGGHTAALQALEVKYLRCLAWSAMPMLIMGAVNGFFSGRGQTWVVLGIEAFGTAVNVLMATMLIFGMSIPTLGIHIPELGIEGAGWATGAGSWASALLAMALFLRPTYQAAFATVSAWKPERELFGRLMRYGGPAGMQVFLDVLVFHLFTQLVGRLGEAEMGATTLTVRLNMVAFLPMMGLGQAISILVGQRLGANRPDLAEKSAYTGLKWVFGYMCIIATLYVTVPKLLVSIFEGDSKDFAAIAELVPTMLLCVAMFSLADAINVSFAFALRGAGDTWFVSLLTFCLAWPLMVVPTWVVVHIGASVYWAWAFATMHIFAMAVCFFFRFRSGKWKTMRVIEAAPDAAAAG